MTTIATPLRLCARVIAMLAATIPVHAGPDLSGIERIAGPGIPGGFVVWDEAIEPLVVHDAWAVVVAGSHGPNGGRVVAFGHTGYLGATEHDTELFVARAARWAGLGSAGDQPVRAAGLRAGVLDAAGSGGVAGSGLADSGLSWREALRGRDAHVVAIPTHELTEDDIRLVRGWVEDGRGVLLSGLGWGWMQITGRPIEEHPGNRLASRWGFAWGPGYVDDPGGAGFAVAERDDDARVGAHAGLVLRALERDPGALDGAGSRALTRTLNAYPLAGAKPGGVRDRLRAILGAQSDRLDARYATMAEDGLTYERDALARLHIELYMSDDERGFDAAPSHVRPHASHAGFPGAIAGDAPRARIEARIDPAQPGWQATGGYAPAGEPIQIEIPADAITNGWSVQIGSHLDPETRGPLNRLPRVIRRAELTSARTTIANPVGGLVYVDIPTDAAKSGRRPGDEPVRVVISGVVDAPVFIAGETTDDDWRDRVRSFPGAWGELIGDDVILTLPREVLVTLDNPAELMAHWSEVVRAMGALQPRKSSGMPDRPARLVPDISVSWGYMYAPADRPLTFPLHSSRVMVDLEVLEGNIHGDVWGLYHELGHWHQDDMWTFGGTGEVTVNIFTLYVLDLVCGLDAGEARGFTPERCLEVMRAHHDAGAPFDRWTRDPFLALTMYVQLRQAFGWGLYERVFAAYRDLPSDQRPRTDAEKRDRWMEMLSRDTQRDLSGFFAAWGVPISDEAAGQVGALEPWMPEGW